MIGPDGRYVWHRIAAARTWQALFLQLTTVRSQQGVEGLDCSANAAIEGVEPVEESEPAETRF